MATKCHTRTNTASLFADRFIPQVPQGYKTMTEVDQTITQPGGVTLPKLILEAIEVVNY